PTPLYTPSLHDALPICEMIAHHRGAAPRRTDHVLEAGEHVDHLPRQRPRVVEKAAVGHRLPAASLRLGKADGRAIALEHRGGGEDRKSTRLNSSHLVIS